jgi:HlyD family secretion protein
MLKALNFLRARLGWLIALAIIVLAVGGYVLYQRYQAEQARRQSLAALRTETVRRGDIVSVVGATGSVLAEQQANLFFLLPGTVAEVLVESGDEVKAGQVLARLDQTDQRLAVQQAKDALAMAELNRQKLLAGPDESAIAVAKANLRAASANASDLQKGAGPQEAAIAQLKYDNLQIAYQRAADQYNTTLQFAKDYPRFAPPPDALDALKAGTESAYYVAEIARLQLEQTKKGAGQGSLSAAYAQITQAQAVLSQTLAAPNAVQIAQADLAVEQARTALDVAELRLERSELVAPFDGVVALVNAKAGELASNLTPAVVLLDPGQFHLDVTVDEVDVAQLSIGQAVTITVDALPGLSLSGRVDRLAPTGTIVGGVVNYAARLTLDSTDASLRAGMSATAEVVVAEVRDVVLVPNWAIRRDRRTGQAYASLKVGDGLIEAPIETGLRGEAYTEVLGGVKEGDVAAVSTEREGIDLFGGG